MLIYSVCLKGLQTVNIVDIIYSTVFLNLIATDNNWSLYKLCLNETQEPTNGKQSILKTLTWTKQIVF